MQRTLEYWENTFQPYFAHIKLLGEIPLNASIRQFAAAGDPEGYFTNIEPSVREALENVYRTDLHENPVTAAVIERLGFLILHEQRLAEPE